jgi:hypothetical protein
MFDPLIGGTARRYSTNMISDHSRQFVSGRAFSDQMFGLRDAITEQFGAFALGDITGALDHERRSSKP